MPYDYLATKRRQATNRAEHFKENASSNRMARCEIVILWSNFSKKEILCETRA